MITGDEYRKLTQEDDVLDHTTLNVTLKELSSKQELRIAGEIKRILHNNQIEKPATTKQQINTAVNYYKVDLESEDIETIIDLFSELEASHLTADGERTPTAAFYAALTDKWSTLP